AGKARHVCDHGGPRAKTLRGIVSTCIDAEWDQRADLHLGPVASGVVQCCADDVPRPTNPLGSGSDSELNAVRERRRGGERSWAGACDLDRDGHVMVPRQPRQRTVVTAEPNTLAAQKTPYRPPGRNQPDEYMRTRDPHGS